MKDLFTTSSGDRCTITISSSSSQSRHRSSDFSSVQRLSRQPSLHDNQRSHQIFAVVVPAKPSYVPKHGTRPQSAPAPYQTINPPFRHSRKILSKKITPGGGIRYHLGAFVPHGHPVDQASPEFIEVSDTDVDDHVSYEELERFEHADFESEVARDNDGFEPRQLQELLQGSLRRGRGRPKKRTGVGPPLICSKEGLLGNANLDNEEDFGGTESDTSSSESEEEADCKTSNAIDATSTEGTRNLQFKVEIPTLSNDTNKTVSPSIFQTSKRSVETSTVLSRLKPSSSSQERASAETSTASIVGVSTSIPCSLSDSGRALVKSDNKDSLSITSKTLEHDATISSKTQPRTGYITVPQPANSKALSPPQGKEGQTRKSSTYEGRQPSVDGLRVVLPHAHSQPAPLSVGTKVISESEDDDEDGGDLLQKFQIPHPKQPKHSDIVYTSGKVVLASIDHKATGKFDVESTSGTYSNDEDDILATRPTPAAAQSNHHRAQSLTQHDAQRRRQLLKTSKSISNPSPDYLQISDNPPKLSTLPSSTSLKHHKCSPAYVSDTDSEDHLAADEQLLQDLRGEKTKVTDAAKSLLRRFQSQPPLKNSLPSSPPLKPLIHKESNIPSIKSKTHIKPAPTHRKTSMTSPFPIGKTIQRNSGPRYKETPDTSASKPLAPPVESDSDPPSKKRKRDRFPRVPPTAPCSDDPEVE